MTAVITAGWAIALVVLLCVRSQLPGDARWWVWTCVAGTAMGLFGLWYVPFLKRRRALAGGRGAAADREQAVAAAPGPDSPPDAQPSSGYVSRDNGSNTVSSTETPGKSTKS